LTRKTYKDSDGKDSTEFKCEKCSKKGKCQDGAYVCTKCKYVGHEKCLNLKYIQIPDAVFVNWFTTYSDG